MAIFYVFLLCCGFDIWIKIQIKSYNGSDLMKGKNLSIRAHSQSILMNMIMSGFYFG